MSRLRLALALLSFLLSFGFASAEDPGLIRATDLLKIKRLGSLSYSSDGKKIVYTVTSIEPGSDQDSKKKDKDKDKPQQEKYEYRTHIFVVPADGSAPARSLTSGKASASDPAWNPRGNQIAFARNVDGKSQIFVLPLDGGEAWQLTDSEYGAQNPRWSPDGTRILFVSNLPQHEIIKQQKGVAPPWPTEKPGRKPGDTGNWGDSDAEKPKADPDGNLQEVREWLARNEAASNPRVLDRINFEGEDDIDADFSYTHLFVIEAKQGATAKQITNGYFSFGGAQWVSDGRIVFGGSIDPSLHPDRQVDNDLFIINADGSGMNTLLDMKGFAVFGPNPSPDGKTVAFAASELPDNTYRQILLGTVPIGGGEPTLISQSLDRDVGDFAWSKDSKSLYFDSAANGGFPLYRIPATGGKIERLTDPAKGIRDFAVSSTGVSYVMTEVADPYELYSAGLNAQQPKRLTFHNLEWLTSRKLSMPEAHQLKRPDGTTVDYWIMKPVPFENGKKYPLLVEMHGGPAAMWGPGEDTTWHEFQFFTAHGFGIVYANPRGSGGYGLHFQAANFQNWGEGPGSDVLAAADEAAKEAWVDADKQVLTGGSYAGYLTAWIVGHDHRFKAAVAQRGVYDLGTFLGESNAWRLVPNDFGGYPWNKDIGEILRRESPITYVDQITTPLMIKHGDNDLRAGVIQSEMLFKSLKILEKPAEYVRYPGATHELSRSGDPLQRVDRLLRFYEFFERYIGN